ncbi:unnamed protein product [Soboliphyme baturini]|uniref:START domain-containing protein n=1 Tax=Soboliphyme baturini TaxID=241478 RepID=A0A183IF53_9BILA|nr:unnamed protein product [Soboliphyme baturini]
MKPGDSQEVDYLMMTLDGVNKIRIYGGPSSVIDTIRQTTKTHWQKGLKEEVDETRAWCYKLNGTPWKTVGKYCVYSRKLLNNIFGALSSDGWVISATIDLTRNPSDKSIFIFRSSTAANRNHCCISLNSKNKMRLIDVKLELAHVIRETINGWWPYGIQKMSDFFGSLEIDLYGMPWIGSPGSCDLIVRVFMCIVLSKLAESHFNVVASCYVSSSSQNDHHRISTRVDVDSWFLASDETHSSENG